MLKSHFEGFEYFHSSMLALSFVPLHLPPALRERRAPSWRRLGLREVGLEPIGAGAFEAIEAPAGDPEI